CSARVQAGTTVTLRATAARGYRFAGWSGGCKGRGACTFRAATVAVVATFRKR
ncbi:MAG: Divergent InlB B-repeat domain, partial [Gaiellaceae bacterium]|nr:Divergent InlB B-repeat domain [Gaiellaceae bacterium]